MTGLNVQDRIYLRKLLGFSLLFAHLVEKDLNADASLVTAFQKATGLQDRKENQQNAMVLAYLQRPIMTPTQSAEEILVSQTLTHLKTVNIFARVAGRVFGEDQLAAKIPGKMAVQEYVSLLEKYKLDSLALLAKKAQNRAP